MGSMRWALSWRVGRSKYSQSRKVSLERFVLSSLLGNVVCATIVAVLFTNLSAGQVATGTPPLGSYGGGPFDVVNLGNFNVRFAVPIRQKAGRGLPFTYSVSYDSSIWAPVTSRASTCWQPATAFGWQGLDP